MTITLNEVDSRISVQLQGRLDTATAPQLEEKLSSLCRDAKELVFDLNGLEYVSSAGLRVILKAQKAMKGSMKLINVNEIVMEIFEITGFTDILTIE